MPAAAAGCSPNRGPAKNSRTPESMHEQRAVIIGAGPAGLTAAFELQTRSHIRPVVLEASGAIGGLARTVNYKGNRMDIGGHRFFSKSDRVMNWWFARLPVQARTGPQAITYQRQTVPVKDGQGPDPAKTDKVLLIRERRSRIYYLRRFFSYPITLSADTIWKLGLWRTLLTALSYIKSSWFPIPAENNLEEFLINRFGRRLYLTFFKSYTEKVWGVPCNRISAEWGMQRIKGLSIRKAVTHALKRMLGGNRSGVAQKETETSLIERFLYPKFGPGQMWEEVARLIETAGNPIHLHQRVDRVRWLSGQITAIEAVDDSSGERLVYAGDYFFSTMPIKDLVRAMGDAVPPHIRNISEGLLYRDFITVGLLLENVKIQDRTAAGARLARDNWIYIQEPDVRVGRLQIFNNWSPYMVADPQTVWLGLEYFCNDTDDLWKLPDAEMIALAKDELSKIGIIDPAGVLDATVMRVPKTYPAYFGAYDRFEELRAWLDGFRNLFLIGRNGMHRYNNQDHSMLTAMVAVDNILAGRLDKSNIWEVNTELDYHEVSSQNDAGLF
jgi:protoporphyrinogen oxidase